MNSPSLFFHLRFWHNTVMMPQDVSLLILISALSLILFVLTLVFMPFMVSLIPVDYFTRENTGLLKKLPFPLSALLTGLKNLTGFLLLGAGLIMLITPGQGLLTIITGLALMNFPGKRSIEIRLVKIQKVAESLNWIRKKMHKPPLEIP